MFRPMRRFLLLAALALGVLGAGCATPTLPLPPPAALSATPPDAMGFVTVEGEVQPEAFVFCLNGVTERGVIERPDDTGHFSLRIEASTTDYLLVWQEIGADTGQRVELEVPDP